MTQECPPTKPGHDTHTKGDRPRVECGRIARPMQAAGSSMPPPSSTGAARSPTTSASSISTKASASWAAVEGLAPQDVTIGLRVQGARRRGRRRGLRPGMRGRRHRRPGRVRPRRRARGLDARRRDGHAALSALADAGLATDDVDGLFAASTQLPWASVNLGEWLGVQPRYSDSTQLGGSSFMAHLHHAALAIDGGAVRGRARRLRLDAAHASAARNASAQEIDPGEAPYRPLNPVTAYALAASRHMHEFGTTREQLAEVAVAARRWAQRNPGAWSREDLTIDDVLAAPMVCDPFGVRDCCLVTDGGAAIVVTRADRARDAHAPARATCSAPARRTATATSAACPTSRRRRGPVRASARSRGRPDAGRHRRRSSSTTRSRSPRSCSSRTSASAPRARAARSSRAGGSRPAASCR